MTMIRFTTALDNAKAWAIANREFLPHGTTLVRDLYGRVRLTLPTPPEMELPESRILELHRSLGNFSPGISKIVISPDQLIAPEAIFESDELSTFSDGLRILDRMITGSNWSLGSLPDDQPRSKRATFYGLKGGVGRSTALATFAIHLASQGQKVLVIDLDLESPGIGALLSKPDELPKFGVVDWFVEDAVFQSDEDLLDHMSTVSPLSAALEGEIRVVAAYGQGERHYIEKLSRTTLGLKREAKLEQFADRLNRMIEALESTIRPDIVLFDSRAGLHDIAAITLSRLGATAFLFAADGIQTWEGYRLLFQHWQNNFHALPAFRDNLKIIDALVPETDRASHRSSITEASHSLFSESIYEEISPENDNQDVFNFDLNDTEAPHFPIPIYWNRAFQGYNPIKDSMVVTPEQIAASYSEFHSAAQKALGF